MCEVLVVDNDLDDRDTFESILTNEGHKVIIASNWRDAERILKRDRFTMALLDLLTPGLNGNSTDIIKRVRLLDPNILLIATAFHTQSIPDSIFKEAHDFISKPISRELLVQITKRAIERKAKKELEGVCVYPESQIDIFKPMIDDMKTHRKQVQKTLLGARNKLRNALQTMQTKGAI